MQLKYSTSKMTQAHSSQQNLFITLEVFYTAYKVIFSDQIWARVLLVSQISKVKTLHGRIPFLKINAVIRIYNSELSPIGFLVFCAMKKQSTNWSLKCCWVSLFAVQFFVNILPVLFRKVLSLWSTEACTLRLRGVCQVPHH